jgi:HK97 gp10 family phage protein
MIRGVSQTKAALAEVERRIRLAAPSAARAGAEIVANEMRARAPRDTGTLAGSISVESDGETARAGAGVDYDRFPQLGTVYQVAQPYGEEGARAGTSSVIAAEIVIYRQAIEGGW